MKLRTLTIAMMTVYSICSYSQERGIGKGSLDDQFNYMIYSSEKADNYRIVRSWWMFNIKNQIGDTIQVYKDSLSVLDSMLQVSYVSVDTIQKSNKVLSSKLKNLNDQVDEINFLGVSFLKNSFKSIVWIVWGVFAFLLLVFIVLYKRSNVITTSSIERLEETKTEFEEFKKKALIREQQQMRKMYDEVLKYKNQLNNP